MVDDKPFELEADFDGSVLTGKYIYGMITNSFSVAGFKIRGAKHVVLDDGKFDCLFIKMPQNVSELQQILSATLKNEFDDESELFFKIKASKIKINSATPIPWTIDGEFGGERTSVTIINEKKAVAIYLNSNYEVGSLGEDTSESAATSMDGFLSLVYEAHVEDEYKDGWD